MKTRFSALDVAAVVSELQGQLVGQRLQNIYDINAKTYLLKFAGAEGQKEFLLIESGIRFHRTVYSREKSDTPSGFCMKLRKHLRTKRLSGLRQLGVDRVIDLKFGENETGASRFTIEPCEWMYGCSLSCE
jgi:predicted ribosome quality control (RQC) complex YloA/Tae2 family protein